MESPYRTAAFICLTLLASLTTAGRCSGFEEKRIEGPVRADIIRVIDGDTLLVAAKPWPQQTMEVYVRLRGIDAPEMKSPCAATRTAGAQAKAALAALAGERSEIRLFHIAGDKYFGRVLADIRLADGRNPAQELLSGGYVRTYHGGRKASDRCTSIW